MNQNDIIPRRFHVTNKSDTNGTTLDVYQQYLERFTRIRSRLPNWKELVRQGNSAVNPYKAEFSLIQHGSYVAHGRYKQSNRWYSMSMENMMSEGLVDPAYVDSGAALHANNEASTQLLKRIRSERQHMSGATFMGELAETIKMVKRPASGMRDYLQKYVNTAKRRHAEARTAKSAAKAVADTWLEYRFGWSPLVGETIAAAESLARFATDIRRTRVVSKGSAKGISPVATYVWNNGGFRIRTETWQEYEVTVNYTAGIKANVYNTDRIVGATSRLGELFGASSNDILPTIWNLLPWSFVVDYFTNVGDIIEACTTDTSDVYFVSRSLKTVQRRRVIQQVLARYDDVYNIPGQSGGGFTIQRIEFSRGGEITYPRLEFSVPKIGQIANLAALFVSARSGPLKVK